MSRVRFDFTGERGLVTGAAGLIGRALVHRFAAAGAEVLAVDVDAEGLKAFDACRGSARCPATWPARTSPTPCSSGCAATAAWTCW
ncbi:NAD-dependent epimerase/dehydratase family protein [Actinomadura sp. GC306]|uniref:NAD-dependent epimerase/dehydratase family protein n=1 Tax=Actinomadura sp. GC306 TaxID=2530367 RepID=UPI00104A66F7|nr:NAD-dependent epimerase/dehydratase family protein [Actinomadura sp. GC306]TDC67034.1 NAD-dependent epimerase/dehydratase family protein [Actinomadura sp. GC306]